MVLDLREYPKDDLWHKYSVVGFHRDEPGGYSPFKLLRVARGTVFGNHDVQSGDDNCSLQRGNIGVQYAGDVDIQYLLVGINAAKDAVHQIAQWGANLAETVRKQFGNVNSSRRALLQTADPGWNSAGEVEFQYASPGVNSAEDPGTQFGTINSAETPGSQNGFVPLFAIQTEGEEPRQRALVRYNPEEGLGIGSSYLLEDEDAVRKSRV